MYTGAKKYIVKEHGMSELSGSRIFLSKMEELLTLQKTGKITDEEWCFRYDALMAGEAQSHESIGPLLIEKQLENIGSSITSNVNQRFQVKEKEESEREARAGFEIKQNLTEERKKKKPGRKQSDK